MKKGFKIMIQILLAFAGALLVLVFLAFSAKSEIVPEIYAIAESDKTALAVRGNYRWSSFSESVMVDNIDPQDYVYDNNHILLVTPGEKITFQNSKNPLNCYKFYQLEMKYYDSLGNEVVIPLAENSKAYADLKYLEINAPTNEGGYIYHFRFSYYNKGEVSYGLKVVVLSEPNYEVSDLIRYKNTSLKDRESIQDILDLLPYAKYKSGIIARTNVTPQELQIGYNSLAIKKEDLMNHAIAMFTLIPELDLITYQTENEICTYTRSEIENRVGRVLKDYANDIELWKSEILFKEYKMDERVTRDEIYKAIVTDIVSENLNSENTMLILDTKSFAENDLLELTTVDQKEILEYAASLFSVIYDMSEEEYDRLHSQELLISLSSIKQSVKFENAERGETMGSQEESSENEDNTKENEVSQGNEVVEEGKYICQMRVSENGTTKFVEYEVQYLEGKWNIIKL